jgi:hypothetical protein
MDLIITKEFQWCDHFLNHKTDAPDINLVITELRNIKEAYGQVTPENVITEAKAESSILHCFFEWNDTEAARRYRMSQASKMLRSIEVKVIKDSEPIYIRAYEVLQRDNRNKKVEYKDISSVEDIEPLKKFIISDLRKIMKKISVYDNSEKIIEHLNETISLIEQMDLEARKELKRIA